MLAPTDVIVRRMATEPTISLRFRHAVSLLGPPHRDSLALFPGKDIMMTEWRQKSINPMVGQGGPEHFSGRRDSDEGVRGAARQPPIPR